MSDSHLKPGTEPLILLVHKDPDIVSAITQMLAAEGYRVHHENTALQAQRFLESLLDTGAATPDLTLLDDLEHAGDVVAFLDVLEAKANTPPRVVLFSELPRQKFRELPRKIRAIAIIVHPSDTKDLTRIIRATVGPGSHTDLTRELENSHGPASSNDEQA